MTRLRNICLLLIAVVSIAGAQTADDLFERANADYRAGRYSEAAAAYQQIAAQGWISPALYYNLGNAEYRLGHIARAMLAYERSARLNPADQDIRHNLRLLSLKTIDRIEPVPELFLVQWIRAGSAILSPSTVRAIFFTAWTLLFCALASLYMFPQPAIGKTARIVALVSVLVVAAGIVVMALGRWAEDSHDTAIVTAPTATVKSSPDAQSVDAFVVHEGLKVVLSDAVGPWVKITLPDGKVGWIPAQSCERI